MHKYAEIGDTVYFWFAANTTGGVASDGADPLYDVRLAGAAADAAPTASGSPTLLSHANYTNGLYEIAINTTGYSVGEYAVFCTLTISEVNPAGFCGSFKLRTAGTGALNVTLADGAITSDKFDESTAFPITSADTGETQIARTGADGDTLETISDEIAVLPTASEIQVELEENGASLLDTIRDLIDTEIAVILKAVKALLGMV